MNTNTNTNTNIIVPSNPVDRKTIKDGIIEACNSMSRIDAEKEQITTIVEDLVEKFEIPKSVLNRMIRIAHKQTIDKVSQENEDFGVIYEAIMG